MATLHKFKLLATQCAVPWTPTRSPTTSPVVHLRRRRKTLRMFLRRFPLRGHSPDRRGKDGDTPEKLVVRHKLKELFLSSPPLEKRISEKLRDVEQGFLPGTGCDGGSVGRHEGRRSFRQRLLRRHWRPVLVTIPE